MPPLLNIFLLGAGLSLVFSLLVARGAHALGVVDRPGLRKIHHTPIPRLGGVAIFASLLLAVAAAVAVQRPGVLLNRHEPLVGALAGGTLILLAGTIDDVRGLRARAKLAAQVIAATVVYYSGVRIDDLSIDGVVHLPLGSLSYPLTLLWIVGVTNAVNLIDGLDGLAAGVATLACVVLAVFGLRLGEATLLVWVTALLGSLTGFLACNWHPARIFMGDSGSNLVGFLLATFAVIGAPASSGLEAFAAFCLVLAVPIFDTLFSMLRRVLERRSLFAPDRKHVHHQLLARGFSHRQAVAVLYAITAVAGSFGVVAFLGSGFIALSSLVLGFAFVLVSFRWIGAVRLREAVATLLRNREMARQGRVLRERFEELELLLQDVRTFDQWWRVIRLAAERLGCAQLSLHFDGYEDGDGGRDGDGDRDGDGGRDGEDDGDGDGHEDGGKRLLQGLVWQRSLRTATQSPLIVTRVPIPHSYNGRELCAEIQVPVTDSLEMATRGVTLIGRLIDERRVPEAGSQEVFVDEAARAVVSHR